MGIPVLLASFDLYLRGSLRGIVILIGSLASFHYQYLLWTIDWAYNTLFLTHFVDFSLSLCTLTLVVSGIDRTQARARISERFLVATAESFSFALGGLLLFECLGELYRASAITRCLPPFDL